MSYSSVSVVGAELFHVPDREGDPDPDPATDYQTDITEGQSCRFH